MRIHHLALAKRSDPHPGGVPLFGHLLATRLGALEWSLDDLPVSERVPWQGPDFEPVNAARLGLWLCGQGQIAHEDTVVADGFWGRGIPGDWLERQLVSVAHNTWRSIAEAMGPHAGSAHVLGQYQAPEYQRARTVAVSQQTARDLQRLYGVEAAAVIRNGVDLEEFRPRPHPPGPITVLYPSTAYPKGSDVVEALEARMEGRGLRFKHMGGQIGEEAAALRCGDVFLAPSRTEGCSYAALQALASGLPVVASHTGIFANGASLDGYVVGNTVPEAGTEEHVLREWEAALRATIEAREVLGAQARAWAEQYAGLDRWEAEWRRLFAI